MRHILNASTYYYIIILKVTLETVVAQRPRLSVNMTGCGFDFHEGSLVPPVNMQDTLS